MDCNEYRLTQLLTKWLFVCSGVKRALVLFFPTTVEEKQNEKEPQTRSPKALSSVVHCASFVTVVSWLFIYTLVKKPFSQEAKYKKKKNKNVLFSRRIESVNKTGKYTNSTLLHLATVQREERKKTKNCQYNDNRRSKSTSNKSSQNSSSGTFIRLHQWNWRLFLTVHTASNHNHSGIDDNMNWSRTCAATNRKITWKKALKLHRKTINCCFFRSLNNICTLSHILTQMQFPWHFEKQHKNISITAVAHIET